MSVSARRGSAGGASLSPSTVAAIRVGAAEDAPSVTRLIQQLVRVPSRAGLDPYEPVVGLIGAWLRERGLAPRQLTSPTGDLLGLACDVPGRHPGPRYVLDACIDTAPLGDERVRRSRAGPTELPTAGPHRPCRTTGAWGSDR